MVVRACCVSIAILMPCIAAPAGPPESVPAMRLRRPHPTSGSLDESLSRMRSMIERYAVDRDNLLRLNTVPMWGGRLNHLKDFYEQWQTDLGGVNFDSLDHEGRVDYLLLQNQLRYELQSIEHERARLEEMRPIIPFADTIVRLVVDRQRMKSIDPETAAAALHEMSSDIDAMRTQLEQETDVKPVVAYRAARTIDQLARALDEWYRFYEGYDPLFTWWVKAPYERVEEDLTAYAAFVREHLVGIEDGDADAIIGDPIGREALLSALAHEMIVYTPEELIEIARREYAWCLAQMQQASRDLGFGDDWHAALDHVKSLHVGPGEQPQLIRELALEAIQFLKDRDLVTIPPMCEDSWRMDMMSPARQKVSPYFLGGERIIVSFPTDDMDHADKLMSMRGNNAHFSRATVHHELIPGHHLQGFMTARHRTHRRVFRTPFWGEGWALYWEMLLWDLDFAQTPENRVGMLFWRMHRCARIIFSLSFHLEQMTPEEAIEFLIENVGHERNNATAEVRRSVGGDYGPLYQAAYMLGGLQIRALHRDLVKSGAMTNREFHDTILRHNSIPIEMVRAILTRQELSTDFQPSWRFYGEIEPGN